MESLAQLIWYAIPGGVLIIAVVLVSPVCGGDNAALYLAAAPIVGFVVNQFARALTHHLSCCPSCRPVLRMILDASDSTSGRKSGSWARRIWFAGIFGQGFPLQYLDRNRRDSLMFIGMVSFILSTAGAWAILGFAGDSCDCLSVSGFGSFRPWLSWALGLTIAFFAFWAGLHWLEMVRFEVLMYNSNDSAFRRLARTSKPDERTICAIGHVVAGFIAGFALAMALVALC